MGEIVEFFDTDKVKIAEITKKDGLMKDKWGVDIVGAFDRRFLIFLPLFIGN